MGSEFVAATATKQERLRSFERPDWRSWVQLIETGAGLSAAWLLTDLAMRVSVVLGALSSLLVAVFMVRAFIIFHDCGHGSFTASPRANKIIGSVIGVLVCTPYAHWTRDHAKHHATVGDLDRRGVGDIWLMTVDEFSKASPRRRRYYRIVHSSWFLVSIGPVLKFMLLERLNTGATARDGRVKRGVYLTNVGIIGFVAGMVYLMGPMQFVVAQLVAITAAGTTAICLFWAQHNFEGTYWRRHADWDYVEASLEGSSRLALPRFLQWVTGNIGYHHIHHLAPRIPNYLLPDAQASCPDLEPGRTLTLRNVFSVPHTNLWDEANARYVRFSEAAR